MTFPTVFAVRLKAERILRNVDLMADTLSRLTGEAADPVHITLIDIATRKRGEQAA